MNYAPSQDVGILIVDSHGNCAHVGRALRAAGYTCFFARGPLRMRAVLESCQVDVIVWQVQPGAEDLQRDLYRECESYPQIPIVALAEGALGRQHPLSARANGVVLPQADDMNDLVALVDGYFHRGSVTPIINNKSELDFRNVLGRMRVADVLSAEGTAYTDAQLNMPDTSINAGERAHLVEADTGAGGSKPKTGGGPLKRFFGRMN